MKNVFVLMALLLVSGSLSHASTVDCRATVYAFDESGDELENNRVTYGTEEFTVEYENQAQGRLILSNTKHPEYKFTYVLNGKNEDSSITRYEAKAAESGQDQVVVQTSVSSNSGSAIYSVHEIINKQKMVTKKVVILNCTSGK